ncbi:peptidoglycan-associated lipoprotein Pal [Phenylobacterium sp. J367]|uniref:peptidoglycan-associated lipoprotein Pal n=1 Tax=Phenylobacterium sp. J367 TaxID=2898435 RepID=UPI002151B362|nr:peptidoglycan-associated lipoprotein Pal [Phenylobacterium sp. J367]MCR5878489.1 peptidoglycan-associated lipoprotein Pal [Phenylobacterium sp. J367]
MALSYNKTAVNLTLVAAAALSLAACSRPKPPLDTRPPASTTQPAPPPTSQPGPVSSQPTGALPGSAQDFTVNVGDRVLFDFDRYDIRADAQPVLSAQAAWLRRYPSVRVRIEGNTDELGTREYNLALGARRANAVRDFLVSNGVTADRIATVSYGKEQPVDTSGTDEGHAQNRNAKTAIVSGAR